MAQNLTKTQSTLMFLAILLLLPIALGDKHHQNTPNRSNTISKRRYGDTTSPSESYSYNPQTSGCGSCRIREEIKNRNLEAIKDEVLRRMGFQSAPNVTGRNLPKVPPHVLAMFDQGYGGMQSDEPQFKTGFSISEEEDDFHVKTEKVLTFAQPCKSRFFIVLG